MHWRGGAAGTVHLRSGLLLARSIKLELLRDGAELRQLHCWPFLCRQRITADAMQLQCRFLLSSGGRYCVQWGDSFLCPVRPRRLLRWPFGTAGAVFARVHLSQPVERLFSVYTRAICRR